MTAIAPIEALPFLDGIVYGEGPRWHDGRLWFTDGPVGRVYSAGPGGELVVEAEVEKPSGLGWLPDGTLVVSALGAPTMYFVDPQRNLTSSQDLSHLAWSTNDLLVTPDGRIYVDLYQLTPNGVAGNIGLVGSDRTVRLVAERLALPNGMGLLPDGKTLVVSDTKGARLLTFPIHPDGSLGAPDLFADIGPRRHPDGLCVDVEGGVWVGCYDTAEFLRVVQGGTVTHRIAVDDAWAVAPALGGDDGRTLYLVIDRTTHEGFLNGDSTGWIRQARVDVPGAGSP